MKTTRMPGCHFCKVSSQRMLLSAELTFRESTRSKGYSFSPTLSMLTLTSELRDRCGDTPQPSDPSINKILRYLSGLSRIRFRHWRGVRGWVWLLTEVEITKPDCCRHYLRNYSYFWTVCTYMSSSAPEEVLLTVGFSGAALFLGTKILLTPQNIDVLRMAPKFCGSVILSHSTQMPYSQSPDCCAGLASRVVHLMIMFWWGWWLTRLFIFSFVLKTMGIFNYCALLITLVARQLDLTDSESDRISTSIFLRPAAKAISIGFTPYRYSYLGAAVLNQPPSLSKPSLILLSVTIT